MTTMVEKVARAIMIAREGGDCKVEDWRREEVENPNVAQALRQAKAAIEAMREPTDDQNGMLEAMWNAMFDSPFDGSTLPMLGAGFDAAIAAALKESEETR